MPGPASSSSIDPHLFVILGATGDLTGRKLLPALHRLTRQGKLGPRSYILGAAADTDVDDKAFRARCRQWLRNDGVPDAQLSDGWCDEQLFYQPVAKGEACDYRALADRLAALEKQLQLPGNRVFYLALPPAVFPSAIQRLGESGLNRSAGWTRLVIEKPFGRDLSSAEKLNLLIHQSFDESQVYRIDHYLGKETVRNLLVLRFANSIFEPLWNRDHVAAVEVTVAETLGVEHRALYYETAGALRDMVQSHLTQLFTLAAMEAPSSMGAEAIREEKLKVLHSVEPIRREDVVLGQYARGTIEGKAVPAYREEPRVAEDSQTETFVALRLSVANWRWHGVPFLLRTGKRLAAHASQIVVTFRRPPVVMFQPFAGEIQANKLVIAIQPDEGFDLSFEIKSPGQDLQLQRHNLHFRYSEAFGPLADAYETLLFDVVLGDATLFVRDDAVEASWGLYTPVLTNRPPVISYAAGTWGPPESSRLFPDSRCDWTTP